MKLIRPTKGKITSKFGWRLKPKAGWHSGIDSAEAMGTPVKVAYKGVVCFAGERGNYGLCVIIEHPSIKNVWTLYAHLSLIEKKRLNWVEQGEVIGKTGNSGYSTGPHLHFEVRVGRNGILFAKDPLKYIS